MGWTKHGITKVGERDRAEENPTIRDVWTNIRVILNHTAGIFATLATLATQITRLDARLEHLSGQITAKLPDPPDDPEPTQ